LPPPKVSGPTLPGGISFNGNYPNPFNAYTVLSYELPRSAHISICVYNIRGQKIAVLYDGDQAEGEHKLTWDASDFPSGVYFARFEAGNYRGHQRMVLLK
jgi:hypothetical protein